MTELLTGIPAGWLEKSSIQARSMAGGGGSEGSAYPPPPN